MRYGTSEAPGAALLLCDSYDPGKVALRSNKRGCGESCDLIGLVLA